MENWAEEMTMFFKVSGEEKRIEDFKPADEIKRLQNINAELLEALKLSRQYLSKMIADGVNTVLLPQTALDRINKAISRAERKE